MAARNNKARLGLVFLAIFTINAATASEIASTPKHEAILLKLENHLAACINISKATTFTAQGVLFAKIAYQQIHSSADCYCKSAISTYASYTSHGGENSDKSNLMAGNFIFGKSGTLNLPLAVEQSLIRNKTVSLVFSCAAPE